MSENEITQAVLVGQERTNFALISLSVMERVNAAGSAEWKLSDCEPFYPSFPPPSSSHKWWPNCQYAFFAHKKNLCVCVCMCRCIYVHTLPKIVMCLNWSILRDKSVHSSSRRDRQGDFCCVLVHQAVSVLSCQQGVHAHICTQDTNFNVYT